jgi:hypothetical protein
MPFDDLAQMRAEMLMRQEQPVYDDGASQLGMNPYMQTVGLFGKGKPKPVAPPIDIQRRSILGLKPQEPMPANLPAVRSSDVPVPSAVPVPQAPTQPIPEPTQPAPLTQLANKALNAPISRREVLKKTGQVALNQMLPTPKVADVIPEVVSPLTQAAQSIFTPNKNIDFFLKDYLHRTFDDAYGQEPQAVAQSMWIFMRDYLKDKLPEDRVKTLDRLARLKNGRLKSGSSDNISDDDAHDLFIHLSSHIHNLKPHEIVNVLEELNQQGIDTSELHYEMKHHYKPPEIPENPFIAQRNKELGLDPAAYYDRLNTYSQLTDEPVPSFENVSPSEFEQYIEQSLQQAQKEKKAAKKEDK